MGLWIFGVVVGILLCGFLPIDTMTKFHDGLVKIVTLGRAKIKEKLKKE